jgi:DNA-binding response OmpR family regulator
MARPSLEGRSILVVEDQPLIVMDITLEFEPTGAALTTTNTLKHALILVEHDGLAGAILDHALPDGNSSLLCQRLRERCIPFMIYSGYGTIDGPYADALHIAKPAAPGTLVTAMEGLIMRNAVAKVEIGPLLSEQRRIADEYRAVEKVVEALHKTLAATSFDQAQRAQAETSISSASARLMRLGQQMLDLDASVTAEKNEERGTSAGRGT